MDFLVQRFQHYLHLLVVLCGFLELMLSQACDFGHLGEDITLVLRADRIRDAKANGKLALDRPNLFAEEPRIIAIAGHF